MLTPIFSYLRGGPIFFIFVASSKSEITLPFKLVSPNYAGCASSPCLFIIGHFRSDIVDFDNLMANKWQFGLRSEGINEHHGIAEGIGKQITSPCYSYRIAINPPPQPCRVVTRAVISQSTFFVPFHPRVPIPLQPYLRGTSTRLIRRTAVGAILLVGNDLRPIIQFQAGRAKMVAELETDELLGYARLVALDARLHQGNAPLVIHYVQRLAHEWARPMPAVDLKSTQIDALVLPGRRRARCGLSLGDLAHTLPSGVVDVERGLGRAAVADRLLRCSSELVLIVPPHLGQMRHACHVAVSVVCIAHRLATYGRGAQAIVRLGLLDQARLVVGVAACPAAAARRMNHAGDVAGLVVLIRLGVAAHGLAVAGMGQTHARRIGRTGRRRWPQLAASGLP